MKNDSGIILIVAVWIVALLSILAIGMSRALSVDLSLVDHMVKHLRSKVAIRSALPYLVENFKQADTDLSSPFDLSYPCSFKASTNEFQHSIATVQVGSDASFDLRQPIIQERDGILDVKAKLNLNALNQRNYIVLAELLQLASDLNEDDSHDLALSIVDWIDADDQTSVTVLGSGAEQNEYDNERWPIKVKNRPINALEELTLVKGMNKNILQDVESYVTAYITDEDQEMLFNLNMTDPLIIKALGRSFPNTSESTVDAAVDAIDHYRRGVDGEYCTSDDQTLSGSEQYALDERFSQSERVVYQNLKNVSNEGGSFIINARLRGRDNASDYETIADIIFDVNNQRIIRWDSY